ncbi:zona pellucida sperm-binding protein 3 isoform X2 [Amia ocellicauda]|uniref:zona pellucida sperm-binding protein 3 isoform X2 n=1 Tax=Amia ocellicauda TaxID=2972642 RepID=UPI003463875C
MLAVSASRCGLLVLMVIAVLCDAGRVSKWAKAQPPARGMPAVRAQPPARGMPAVRAQPPARGMPAVRAQPPARGMPAVRAQPPARGMPAVRAQPPARGMPAVRAQPPARGMPAVRAQPPARGMPAVRAQPPARGMPAVRAKAFVRVDSPLFKQQVSPVVLAQCGESTIEVSVKRDLFGTGELIAASDIKLGDCALSRQDDSGNVLVFQSELQGCLSTLSMTEDELVYSFSLNYNPSPIANTGIVRTNPAVVRIECLYPRLHNVSSNALQPTWVPYTSTKSAEDVLDFSLQLMTDDWSSPRPSNVYFLGDVLNIEASVNQASHVPLRLFVDSCVATLTSDPTSSPSYTFIGNHGCLIDGKVTGSSSLFMPRSLNSTLLQMQLDAFRFHQDARSSIYISCQLTATAASQAVDSMNKACTFNTGANRWQSVDGSDQVCGCCDSSCGSAARYFRRGRDLAAREAPQWEGDATVALVVLEDPLNAVLPVETGAQRSQLMAKDARGTGIPAEGVMLAGVVTAVGLVCIAVLGAVLYRWTPKSTA